MSQDQAKLMCYFLNLIKHQRPDVGKTCLYVENSFESKYQLLIKERENVGAKQTKNTKVFTDYSQTIDDVYTNLEYYNPTKKRIALKVFDDMIEDMNANKILISIVAKLFLRGKN